MSTIARTYDNIALTTFVREIVTRPDAPGDDVLTLTRWLPNRFRDTRAFKVRKFQKTNAAGRFRSFDAPSPVAGRPGYTEQTGTIPPISQSMIVGEEETLDIYERVQRGAWDQSTDGLIYNDAAMCLDLILNRLTIARAHLLVTGKFEMTFDDDGLVAEADFGRRVGNALTAAATWANAGSSILTDLQTAQEASRDENGTALTVALASTQAINRMLANTEIKAQLGAFGNPTPIATLGALNSLLEALDLPQVIRYDHKIDGERLIHADTVVLLPNPTPDLGETRFGTTAESIVLDVTTAGLAAPGVVATVQTRENPVQVLTDVTALAMPMLNNADLVYTLDTVP